MINGMLLTKIGLLAEIIFLQTRLNGLVWPNPVLHLSPKIGPSVHATVPIKMGSNLQPETTTLQHKRRSQTPQTLWCSCYGEDIVPTASSVFSQSWCSDYLFYDLAVTARYTQLQNDVLQLHNISPPATRSQSESIL